MKVRSTIIESNVAFKTARWTIPTIKKWQAAANRPSSNPTHLLAAFIRNKWTKGNPIPSSLSWNRDVLTLGEFLCVIIKILTKENKHTNNTLISWIINGITIAAKEWSITSSHHSLSEIISIATWLDNFNSHSTNEPSPPGHKIRVNAITAFSHCKPDLTHAPTLDNYFHCWECIENNNPATLIESLEKANILLIKNQLTTTINTLENAAKRLASPTNTTNQKTLLQNELALLNICTDLQKIT